MSIQPFQLYIAKTSGTSTTVEPVQMDPETGFLPVQLYAVKVAGGSSSIQPVNSDVDGRIS
jgi:hypothetical protein